jgi:glycosyltransferase involved in cell wall biosynthesis
VFVDSGSSDNSLHHLPHGSTVHKYVGNEFNYSEALNQGVEHVKTDYVLIVSSHTSLRNTRAVAYALELLGANENLGAAYFTNEDRGELTHELIDTKRFDGFNGLWNTCSLIKVCLLRRRGFRPEVFATEDQEWANWLFQSERMLTARISGAGMANNNPRKSSIKKRLNEYVAIAYFSNRMLLAPSNLARVIFAAIKPDLRFRLRDRFFHLVLFIRLVGCHFAKPRAKSRYF